MQPLRIDLVIMFPGVIWLYDFIDNLHFVFAGTVVFADN